jgi:hypothetical protein
LPVPGPRNFLHRSGGGPRGFTAHFRRPLPLALLPSLSGPPESPDTLSPTCLPTSPRATTRTDKSDHESPATFTANPSKISHFFLLCVSGQRRSSDLSITLSGLQYACATTRTKNSNAPTIASRRILHKTPISRCQGKSRSGRPVVVSGAPLNLPRARVLPCDDDPSASPPPLTSLHLRRDHHRPISSSHVCLSTINNSICMHNTVTRMIFQSPEHRLHHALRSRLLQQRTHFNMEPSTPSRCKRFLTQSDSHSHYMPPGVHVVAPPAAKPATNLPPSYTVR